MKIRERIKFVRKAIYEGNPPRPGLAGINVAHGVMFCTDGFRFHATKAPSSKEEKYALEAHLEDLGIGPLVDKESTKRLLVKVRGLHVLPSAPPLAEITVGTQFFHDLIPPYAAGEKVRIAIHGTRLVVQTENSYTVLVRLVPGEADWYTPTFPEEEE